MCPSRQDHQARSRPSARRIPDPPQRPPASPGAGQRRQLQLFAGGLELLRSIFAMQHPPTYRNPNKDLTSTD